MIIGFDGKANYPLAINATSHTTIMPELAVDIDSFCIVSPFLAKDDDDTSPTSQRIRLAHDCPDDVAGDHNAISILKDCSWFNIIHLDYATRCRKLISFAESLIERLARDELQNGSKPRSRSLDNGANDRFGLCDVLQCGVSLQDWLGRNAFYVDHLGELGLSNFESGGRTQTVLTCNYCGIRLGASRLIGNETDTLFPGVC